MESTPPYRPESHTAAEEMKVRAAGDRRVPGPEGAGLMPQRRQCPAHLGKKSHFRGRRDSSQPSRRHSASGKPSPVGSGE